MTWTVFAFKGDDSCQRTVCVRPLPWKKYCQKNRLLSCGVKLFGISMPLGPLLALLTNLIDLRVDARRLLWWYRRPVATIAQDIGMWFNILQFINFVGVISSGFILGFTSSWGSGYSTTGKLIIVIAFEHIVFALKYIIAYMIPDTPAPIQLAIRREQYQIMKMMEEPEDNVVYTQLFPGWGDGDHTVVQSRRGPPAMLSQVQESPLQHQGVENGGFVTYFNTTPKKNSGGPGSQLSQLSSSDIRPQPKLKTSWETVEVEASLSPGMTPEPTAHRASH